MKRCPQCGQTYNDGSLNFCLMDGAPLAETDSEPTVIIGGSASSVPTVTSAGEPPPRPRNASTPPLLGGEPDPGIQLPKTQRRGSRTFLWVGLLVLIILVGGGGLVGLLIYYFDANRKMERVYLPNVVNTASSPKRTSSPKPSPSPESSPVLTPAEEPSVARDENNQNEYPDEVTPIVWGTAAIGFKDDVGRTYRFQCPAGGTASAIWGSDIYTSDSSICTAAVHAGVITLEDGGVITIEFRPGRQIYGSTVRNGITSNTFGEYPKSFVFKQ